MRAIMLKHKNFPENIQQLDQIIQDWPSEATIYDSHFEKYLKTSKSGLYYAYSLVNQGWILWMHKSDENCKHELESIKKMHENFQ